MTRLISTFALLLIAFTTLALRPMPGHEELEKVQFHGEAYALDSDDYLYRETHLAYFDDDDHHYSKVVYTGADGDTIAIKQIDYRHDPMQPGFRTEDLRDGYIEGVEVRGDSIRIFNRKSAEHDFEEKIVPLHDNLVIDAGFVYCVQRHWDELVQGETVKFDFVLPSHLKTIGFQLKNDGETTFEGRPALRLKMELSSFFWRLFVDSVHLTFDLQTQQLLAYEGISNISKPDGGGYMARIVFPQQMQLSSDDNAEPGEK